MRRFEGRAVAGLALGPIALLLGGCAGEVAPRTLREPPPTLRVSPPRAAPESRTLTAGSSERTLEIDLSSALALAGAGSFEVALARERTNEAAARALRFEEAFVPALSLGGWGRAFDGRVWRSTGQYQDATHKQALDGSAGAALDIDVAGTILRALAGAQRADAARAAFEATRLDVAAEAAGNYFELVGSTAQVQVALRGLEEGRELVRNREAFLARGGGLRVDVLRARADLATYEQALTEAQAAVRGAATRLSVTLGLDPSAILVPFEVRPSAVAFVEDDRDESALVAAALDSRPEVLEAEALVRAASRDRDVTTWGPLFPEVGGNASAGSIGPHFDDQKGTEDVSAFIGWRLGPGGIGDLGAMDETAARLAQARISLEREKVRVASEVVLARVRTRAARLRMQRATEGLAAADEALRISREREVQGAGILLDVLDAERVAQRARKEEIDANVEFDTASFQLLRSIGEEPAAVLAHPGAGAPPENRGR